MGKRLSRITTRTGDDGTTGLGDGTRVPKSHPRVAAYGTVDELNSLLGQVLAEELPGDVRNMLNETQHDLFDLGGELCIPGHRIIGDRHVERLEEDQATLDHSMEPLAEFILPGGCRAAATCHVARAVCRRAEREVVGLSASEPVSDASIRYLNRLSDFLFVAARAINIASGEQEIYWKPKRDEDGEAE
jgi:cob(I)alamin adenosyltransferase